MAHFYNNEGFEVYHCCNAGCGVSFALNTEFVQRRRNDKKSFYCPAGHSQWFPDKTEADKLRDELTRKDELLNSTRAHNERLQHEKSVIAKAHSKMRTRVANGVCPCCNRTFQNLMQHMRTEHPDFGKPQALRALRLAFGMTQSAIAEEAYVNQSDVSQYERGKRVSDPAKDQLDYWVEQHSGEKA